MGMYRKNIVAHNTTQTDNTKHDMIPIEEDWLNQNFGEQYIANVRERCIVKNSFEFQTVNAGAYNKKLSPTDTFDGYSKIIIRYIQGENERSCIVFSISNALQYL